MCGIGGWLGHVPESDDVASRVLAALAHRGPDGNGAQTWSDATLLHTRLRIIDLSPTGDQPMANEDGSVWTVFNGELYNHRDLQERLEARGHRFRGRSDTEVLPHLYEEYGDGMFAHLRGMFGVAIFDRPRNRLLLGRDRFGIKPLFYAATGNAVAFASELNALRLVPGLDLTPNRQAIADFASVLYVPAPQTFYRGISALLPGELLDCTLDADGRVRTTATRFHSFAPQRMDVDLASTVDRVEGLLEHAVASQLESDVPLGSLLSGGIDSSLVSAFAMRSLGNLHTYSVKMPDPAFDESWAAQAVAERIGSQHRTLELRRRQADWSHVTAILGQAGQPFADTSVFAVDAVSELMRRHVTVALSGDGGDEGFGGYDVYWQLERAVRLQRVPPFLWRLGMPAVRAGTGLSEWIASVERRLGDFALADDVGIVQALFSWIRPRELGTLLRDASELEPARRLYEPQWEHAVAGVSRTERLSALAVEANVRLVLPNDFLFKVDIASMRHGLEVRVPMLDEDLMDAGLSLPHALRVEGRQAKRVLRAIAERHLPKRVTERPKQGFAIPVDDWVDDDFKRNVGELLLESDSPVAEHLEPASYRPWIRAFTHGEPHPTLTRLSLYQRTVMVLSLDLALRSLRAPATGRPATMVDAA